MELSIIIVNWNAQDYLRECLESIYKFTTEIDFEIIIVDNASTKGDINALKKEFPKIYIIKSKQNLGFAKANNLGYRKAKGNIILFINPDTRLVGPAINILLKWVKLLPDAGIIGCKHVNPDFTVQTTSIQKFPTILNQILNIEFLKLLWPSCPLWNIAPLFSDNHFPLEVEVIPGACMLIRRDTFESVGMFSEDFFMYAEDIDLNFKIKKKGLKNYYVPDAVIIHYGGKSSSQKGINKWATMMKYRAMQIYFLKNYGYTYSIMYKVAMGGCAIFRIILLLIAYPFENILWRGKIIKFTTKKWITVLKWSFGFAEQSLGGKLNN